MGEGAGLGWLGPQPAVREDGAPAGRLDETARGGRDQAKRVCVGCAKRKGPMCRLVPTLLSSFSLCMFESSLERTVYILISAL